MDPKLFDQFVTEAGKRITALRSEAARYRLQRNEARQELTALRDSLKFETQRLVANGLTICGYGGCVCSDCDAKGKSRCDRVLFQ